MDLLRREWGYILYTNLSVQSTLLEGTTANGSLAYRYYQGYSNDSAYTSHAHGWSSGPTSALTIYVVGLSVTAPSGRNWSLAPHIGAGGLEGAQGGFETALGWFGAEWSVQNDSTIYSVNISTPGGTSGVVRMPVLKGMPEDGTVNIDVDGKAIDEEDVTETTNAAGTLLLEFLLAGGNHTIVVSSGSSAVCAED
jgi:hypothetical protein